MTSLPASTSREQEIQPQKGWGTTPAFLFERLDFNSLSPKRELLKRNCPVMMLGYAVNAHGLASYFATVCQP
jgi:hypothetical protein